MKFNNYEIYQKTNAAALAFDKSDMYIPAKVNFFIQKNFNILNEAAQEIENSRIEIAKHYGVLDKESSQYKIPTENMEKASKELNDLFSIIQELNIRTFSIEDLGNVEFTTAQMQAIMFMIED